MKKEIFLILLLITGLGLVSAIDQSRSYNYNYFTNESIDFGFLPFSSVLLEINTPREMICRYSSRRGVLYENMEGRFDETNSIVNKKSFVNLLDGTYRYYVKCQDNTFMEPSELEVILRINSLVTGQILLSKDSPLNDGRIDVTLITSKIVSQAPILTYSFDGLRYNPVVLVGSGKNWRGHIILGRTLGEGVLSFSMRAVDLEGRTGDDILVGKSFPYDTITPPLITDIRAISGVGKITLEWHAPEDVEYFRIYRSNSPNVGYTDFYKESNRNRFIDTSVEDGRNYYYRVTSVDSSNNEADLSREVSGISLSDNENINRGLSPVLRGRVESFILEIESLKERISTVNQDLSNLNEKEKYLFNRLKMFDKISQTTKDLSSLKSSVEKYREQDLTSEELDRRIASSRVQLNIYERGIPEGIKIIEEKTRIEENDEEFVINALYEIDSFLSEKERENSIKQTFNFIEEYEILIESSFYLVEIKNLDGSKNDYYIVKRKLSSNIERLESSYFIEILPKEFVENGRVEVKTLDYSFLSDNVISFGADNKELFYYIEGTFDFSELENIESGFVSVFKEETSSRGLTGLAIFRPEEKNYPWLIGIILMVLIASYFLYSRLNNYSDDYFRTLNKISESSKLAKKKKITDSKKVYFGIKEIYNSLEKREKEKIYRKVKLLYNEILISELEEGLDKLKDSKDKVLFEKMEKVYEALPSTHKEKISILFNKLRNEIKNEK